jgi:hypothetical protein
MRNQLSVSLAASMAVALLGTAGCSEPQEPPAQAAAPAAAPAASPPATGEEELGQPSDPRFIGKIWVSTTLGSSRGSLMIFLPNRTLLMDSCFETYRISKWGAAGDRIRWIEEAIPIQATLSMPDENNLRLHISGQDRVLSYVAQNDPYVCPDMPK